MLRLNNLQTNGGNKQGKPTSQKKPYCRGECKAVYQAPALHNTWGAVGWESHGSSPTRCAGKTDHRFGACVPLALICPLKIVT